MHATPITFSQKWEGMISPEKQMDHCRDAFYNHVITVATATSFVALAVFSSIVFPEIATFLIIGTAFLLSPGVELARIFLNKAQDSKKLEDQTLKVRVIYNRLVAEKADNPEVKGLHEHWNNKASKAKKNYDIVYQKALDKTSNPRTSPAVMTKYRIEALDAEKEAKTIQVYALFLESLTKKQQTFENVFLKYGENLSHAFSDFGTWDCRETEIRAMDPKFTKDDVLLAFCNKKIRPISYSEVYQKKSNPSLKKRLCRALTEQLAS